MLWASAWDEEMKRGSIAWFEIPKASEINGADVFSGSSVCFPERFDGWVHRVAVSSSCGSDKHGGRKIFIPTQAGAHTSRPIV